MDKKLSKYYKKIVKDLEVIDQGNTPGIHPKGPHPKIPNYVNNMTLWIDGDPLEKYYFIEKNAIIDFGLSHGFNIKYDEIKIACYLVIKYFDKLILINECADIQEKEKIILNSAYVSTALELILKSLNSNAVVIKENLDYWSDSYVEQLYDIIGNRNTILEIIIELLLIIRNFKVVTSVGQAREKHTEDILNIAQSLNIPVSSRLDNLKSKLTDEKDNLKNVVKDYRERELRSYQEKLKKTKKWHFFRSEDEKKEQLTILLDLIEGVEQDQHDYYNKRPERIKNRINSIKKEIARIEKFDSL